ncbi:hypothetical protein Trydic_g17425 [Trypoxylus dichotomus]
MHRKPVGAVNKLVTHSNAKEILVVQSNFTGIFVHTIANNSLKLMQTLKLQELSDIIIWENTNGLFLSITREKENSSYTSTCLVYKWLQRYFDQVSHEITTYGSRSITTSSVGSLDFIAIANYQDDEGQTNIYSGIFKYNIDTERYEPHQKLSTNGAMDINFFSVTYNGLEETYLIVANSKKNENHIESVVNSIIYKYVDKYFIPFQSIANRTDKWIATNDAQGRFLLVSLSKTEGVRAFTYNGWIFVAEDFTQLDHFKTGLVYGGFQKYMGNVFLKLTNENFNRRLISLYKLDFIHEEDIKSFEANMLKWCEQTTLKTNNLSIESLKDLHRNITVEEHMDKISERSIRDSKQSEDFEDTDTYLERIEGLNNNLDGLLTEIKVIKADLHNYLRKSGQVQFEGDIYAKNVSLNKEAFFENLFVEAINDKEFIGILENVILINKDYDIEKSPLKFEKVKISSEIRPEYINGKRSEYLLHKNDSITFHDVKIDGRVILADGLNLSGLVNGVDINSSALLLREGDQVINGNVSAWRNIKIRNAKSHFLNELDLTQVPTSPTDVINELDVLKVRDLVVAGLLNGKDIVTLNQYALMTSVSGQNLEECSFEHLDLTNLFVKDYLSGARPEDAFTIHEGAFDLTDKDVLFTGDVSAEKIVIKRTLNHLDIDEDGALPFLLKNSNEEQYVNSLMVFEEVVVANPLNLQVKINSEKLKELNPIRTVPDELIVLKDNFNFTKKVVIEGGIASRDIKTSNSNKSMGDIIAKGLEITSEELLFHLTLKQPLNTRYINVSTINGINLSYLVTNGNDATQEIYGNKIVKSTLHITGSTTIINANNVYIRDLESKVLNVNDDQEIDANHVIQEFTAKSVDAVRTRLGDHIWRDIVTSEENQTIHGTTVINQSTRVKSLYANFTDIEGRVNAYNFTKMLQDTADFNTTNIGGCKTFESLQVENLIVENGVDMEGTQEKLKEFQERFQIKAKSIVLPDHIAVEKLSIDGYLNRMKSEDFVKNWKEESTIQKFYGDRSFDTVTVFEEATILSDEINGFSFRDIVEDTLKVNESNRFDDVTFKEAVYSFETVTLHGNIPGIDLETIIISGREEQTIWNLTFANNVDVVGNLKLNHLINGVNYTHWCNFSQPHPQEPSKNLIITESAHFIKGPSIKQFQNSSIFHFYENIWVGNRETNLDGHIEFEAINFQSNLKVEGLVDGINLTWLANNYFSKTKNQTITGHLDFTDGINFFDGISASEVLLTGLVSGLNFSKFLRSAIINDVEQIFEDTIELESCTIQNIEGDFLVNNLNLPNDVMRYDTHNIVTGVKQISAVVVGNLLLKQNVSVQNVDLLSWIHKAVPNIGGAVNGNSIFHGVLEFSKGLGVAGAINGIVFDNRNVMLKNESQIISGKKIIFTDSRVGFIDVSLKGNLNNVNIMELCQNQAYKNVTNLITSEVRLLGPVTAKNLNIQGLYNNVSISNVISDMQISQDLNNYYESYAQLLNMSNRIKESLKYQAYYLDHYDIVQDFKDVHDIFYLIHENESTIALVNDLRKQIDLFKWNESTKSFGDHFGTIYLKNSRNATYFSLVSIEKEYYLYFEHRNLEDAGETFIGSFTLLNDIENIIANISTPGMNIMHPFVIPNKTQTCFVFVYVNDKHPDIYCKSNSEWNIYFYQELETCTKFEPVTFAIKSTVYILTIDDRTEDNQNCIILWKYDVNTRFFIAHQKMYITASNGISTITYKNVQYLAVSSGHLQGAQYEGSVEVYRFNIMNGSFMHWQDIPIEAPIQVEFAILPSNELVLHVLTNDLIEPLRIYIYEGVNGFQQRHFATSFGEIHRMKQFNTIGNQHFISVWHNNQISLIESYLKGYKIR